MIDVPSGETSSSYRLLTQKFSFRIKAAKDAQLILATEPRVSSPRYEVEIGANENAATIFKRSRDGSKVVQLLQKDTPDVLSNSSFRTFWVELEGDRVVLGSGESFVFFWRDASPLNVKYVFLRSPSLNATFEMCGRVGELTLFLTDRLLID